MCGIAALLVVKNSNTKQEPNGNQTNQLKDNFIERSKLLRHRGPDWSGNWSHESDKHFTVLTHERLSIIDPNGGSQPIIYNYTLLNGEKHSIVLCVNGEIYNHKKLRTELTAAINMHENELKSDDNQLTSQQLTSQQLTSQQLTSQQLNENDLQNNNDTKHYCAYIYQSDSDCECILAWYIHYYNLGKLDRESMIELINKLDGQFSFVLYDTYHNKMLAVRDPIGITSLYMGFNGIDTMEIASELKAINPQFKIEQFPPGHFIDSNIEFTPINYYQNSISGFWTNNFNYDINQTKYKSFHNGPLDFTNQDHVEKEIRTLMINAVKKRLMADVPFGMLLSGGLDSSLVCSIAVRLLKDGMHHDWGNKIHTFSIGLPGAPDLEKAQVVADFLGTIHHAFTFTLEEGLDAVNDIVKYLETYDVTTIRASTPMYLLARKIKAMGVKMVLSGEGADELLGGYLYYMSAPNDEEFHGECVRRMSQLNYFDCLRANKSTMAWGVEGRFPFLDKEVIRLFMSLSPDMKCREVNGRKVEKYILRKSFDVKYDSSQKPVFLPDEILWRQKEQFSDGVGYSWIDTLVEMATKNISDEEMAVAGIKYSVNTPKTKEALYYRKLFMQYYPNHYNSVKLWQPRTDWEGVDGDPSGRAQSCHDQTTRN